MAPLTVSHGTLVCRSPPVKNHCLGLLKRDKINISYINIYAKKMKSPLLFIIAQPRRLERENSHQAKVDFSPNTEKKLYSLLPSFLRECELSLGRRQLELVFFFISLSLSLISPSIAFSPFTICFFPSQHTDIANSLAVIQVQNFER